MTLEDAMTPSMTPRTTVATALRRIRDNRIAHLPVLERGQILGSVREDRILALTPSEATMLSRHEATELLSRLTVARAVEDAVRLEAGTALAEAARALLDRRASAALVVERGQLGGIVTHTDLLRAFVAAAPAEETPSCAR
jgi:acetoin utilization protein AcuB